MTDARLKQDNSGLDYKARKVFRDLGIQIPLKARWDYTQEETLIFVQNKVDGRFRDFVLKVAQDLRKEEWQVVKTTVWHEQWPTRAWHLGVTVLPTPPTMKLLSYAERSLEETT